MNISQLLRSVLGDVQAADSKTLELKVGQVVKGLVLQLLGEQEALVNIGGVHVRARLETPLAQGQVTYLQVQPESTAAAVVLKPLENSGAPIAEESMPELLKRYALKDTAENRRALRELHQEGIPLAKEAVDEYVQALQERPGTAHEDEWSQAALLALKRGLPATKESVGSLHRVLFGQPADQTLERLADEVNVALETKGQTIAPQTRDLLMAVKQALSQISMNVPGMEGQELQGGSAASAKAQISHTSAEVQENNAAAKSEASAREAAQPRMQPQTAGGADVTASAYRSAGRAGEIEDPFVAPFTTQAKGQHGQRNPAGADPQLSGFARGDGKPEGQSQEASANRLAGGNGEAAAGERNAASAVKPAGDDGGSTNDAARTLRSEMSGDTNWIRRLLKELGVDHEQRLLQQSGRAAPSEPEALRMVEGRLQQEDGAPPQTLTASNTAAMQPADKEAQSTLKGLLIQLAQADDAPAAVRDTARQAVQQITGQQLLLTPDRASMFAHVTLMLPLQTPDGRQTAAIHIQSRKGKRGELDATNCRLLFDLDMRALGSTLLDVQVVDKIVSLRVHNDQPFVAKLLEDNRDEIASGLQSVGYQLLSIKYLPYPERLTSLSGDAASGSQGTSGAAGSPQLKGLYKERPYKGMDVRV